jgi:DNA-directed RNA polymerase
MDLVARQIKIEEEYTTEGIKKAIAKWAADLQDGNLANTGVGRAMIVRLYGLVSDELARVCSAGTRGVGGRYRTLLKEVGLENCAVIALRSALGLVGHGRAVAAPDRRRGRTGEPLVQDFISDAGNTLELEHMLAKLQIAAPGYMHRVLSSLDESRTKSMNHRKRTFAASAKNVGVSEVAWSGAEKDGAAKLLLEALVACTVLETYDLPKSRGQSWVGVRATESIQDHVTRMGNAIRAFVVYPPMLVPPQPHTMDTLFTGASYLTPGMRAHSWTLKVRTRRADLRSWIQSNMSQSVLDAGNKAANQPYVVDVETAELLRDLFKQGVYNGVAGIPSSTPLEPPPYPLDASWNREDPALEEIHASWKAQARQVHCDEVVRKSHVMAFHQTMKYLKEYAGDTLYFPTYFDWRGRLYFRSRINPQGTDFVKATLQFANKKPLGERGLYWLKAHIATCYGYDKKGMDARVVWTDTNMPAIRDAVANHIDSDFFRAADSPWCFYVAARELVRALESGAPADWCTGIPVAMDATCSGLQHLSALLRDPVGGMFTNLLPNNGVEKEDIYAGVAAVAISTIQKDTENLVQAKFWLDAGVPRSGAKRPVMTYVYGGTLMSCTEYVFLDMQERGLQGIPDYSQFKLAAYLSRHIRKGIESTVPAAAEAMRFLRQLAGIVPDDGVMRWVSPGGFPVLQHYAKEFVTEIRLAGVGVQVRMTRFDNTMSNRARAINGIAPNFVHSLDSGHLVRVINAFDGSIVPIHDSYATHPCDVDEMHRVLRYEFVQMYTEADPLANLTASVQDFTHDEITPPAQGTLDIRRVLDSEFFMC